MPSWDNTPRAKRELVVFDGAAPERYEHWLSSVLHGARQPAGERPLVFLNAWNEWAEGAHLEPCQRWGTGYLEATRRALAASSAREGGSPVPYEASDHPDRAKILA
jgi:hypothetical protein